MLRRCTHVVQAKILTWLVLAMWLFAPVLAPGEDSVLVQGKEDEQPSRAIGQVMDFTGTGLMLRLPSGRERTIPAADVLEIHSDWTPQHAAADEHFAAGRYAEALDLYRQALAAETRPWTRRLLMAHAVWCCQRLGQTQTAVQGFLPIWQQDPATPYLAAIPLTWVTEPVPPDLESQARTWLGDKQSAAARLIGASWLLATPQRAAATAELRQLTVSEWPELAFLAEAQLWRTTLATASAEEADRWQQRIDRMPKPLRAGPLVLQAQLLARHGRREEAALAFLRIVILHPQHDALAVRSLLGAGGELKRMGQPEEAARLYEEIVSRHSEPSDVVAAARERLERLETKDGS